MSMRLALVLTEAGPEGREAEGEDPVKEAEAVIEKGVYSSHFVKVVKAVCVQDRLFHFGKDQ